MKHKLILLLLLFALKVHAQNVMISNMNDPNEPSIMMDPKNPNVLIAGANLDNYYVSVDTGNTWTEYTMNSTYGVWGDPAVFVDTLSNFYFFHLSNPSNGNWIDRIVCQKTTNNGTTFSNGSYAGLNGTKMQDKEWCGIDRRNNNMYITWTQFDDYGTANPSDSSIILFSKSLDGGITWSTPVRINKVAGDCIDSDNTVEGAVPAVGPNGEIYVAWAGPNGLVFNRSFDEGNTWLSSETPIDPMPTGWDYAIPGIYRANGLPVTACDVSGGAYTGTVYVNWSDQRNGASNTDVWLAKSTDSGQTWTTPIKVNDDNTNRQQFFTWMTVDQATGYLYFVFYDRRNYTNNQTDVYVAVSTDGGTTFINHKISQTPFVPDPNVFFGDYTNITAYNGIVRPIWTRLHNGALSVWTDVTDLSTLLSNEEIVQTKNDLSFENFPNPSHDYTYVSFKLHTRSKINLTILDMNGKVVSQIISNENRDYGKYIERIDLTKLNLPNGTYLLKLEIDDKVEVQRQIKI